MRFFEEDKEKVFTTGIKTTTTKKGEMMMDDVRRLNEVRDNV